MNYIATKLGILLAFLGVAAFGIGIFTAILQGGVAGTCFLAALILGTVALGLDGLTRKPAHFHGMLTTSRPKHGYQIAH